MKKKISEKEVLEKIREQVDKEWLSRCTPELVPPDEGGWDVALGLNPEFDCHDANWDQAKAVLASLEEQYEIVPDADRGEEA